MASRVSLVDMKYQLARQIGADRARKYFSYLNQLLNQKMSKPEFTRLCLLILGKENIPLHNQLIRAILRNAYNAKTEPLEVWPNGNILPPSPRKSRSSIRDRRTKDHPSSLRPNGKVEIVGGDNGILSPCGLERPKQHYQVDQAARRLRMDNSLLVEEVFVEDREEMEESSNLNSTRNVVQAPLGVPFCPASVGGARRPLTLTSSSSSDGREVCHTEALRKRMEGIAEALGVGGVSMNCANLLNYGLDAYMKRLIKSCIEVVGVRSGQEPAKHTVYKQQPHQTPINGGWPGNHMHDQSSSVSFLGTVQQKSHLSVSLQDFKVAMVLNPQQLGEDWPWLLEKICMRSFEE